MTEATAYLIFLIFSDKNKKPENLREVHVIYHPSRQLLSKFVLKLQRTSSLEAALANPTSNIQLSQLAQYAEEADIRIRPWWGSECRDL